MKKIALIMTVVLLAVTLFTGCGQTTTTQETASAAAQASAKTDADKDAAPKDDGEKLQITFVSPLIGMPVWLNAKKGADDAAAEVGAVSNWVGPNEISIEEQVSQVELAIAEGVDGIICCPLNPSAFEDVYKKAMDKGIPVVNTAVDSDEANRFAYIGTDYMNFGQQAAEALAKKMNGKANIAVLQTSMDSDNQNSEREAFEKLIAEKYPDMKIIVTETDDSDMTKAVTKINTMIDAYPELDAIWCLESASGPAAGQVLAERKMIDKVTVLAIDDTDEILGPIEEGTIWGTMTQDFYKMGYEAVKMIKDYHDGKKDSVPSIQDSGTTLVTKENLEEYRNRF